MALSPLAVSDSLVVVQAVPQAAQLPACQQQAIVARAAGNPFFLEELTWAAVAHGDHASTLPLPETIQAVLAARLDRLPPEAKRRVQMVVVIGPAVPVPLLQRLAGLAEDTLQRAWRTSRTRSRSTRRASSPSRSTPLSMRSPTRLRMGVCSRSSGGRCMPAS